MSQISGFSKLSKDEKISWLVSNSSVSETTFKSFWLECKDSQKKLDDLSENTISNFLMPYGIAPNFKINDKVLSIPMVIEESSVVAAASKAAKFWFDKGGFKATVLSTTKIGHIHLTSSLSYDQLNEFFSINKDLYIKSLFSINESMKKRGGGLLSINLLDKTADLENYYQVEAKFETCDAMGANFINTILEQLADSIKSTIPSIEINMSILSNYTPECLVEVKVQSSLSELDHICPELSGLEFASKFKRAIDISKVDVSRAVTHNKGILNGIDAVVLATGNDFRAIEAGCHAYASKSGSYRGLSDCIITDRSFEFKLLVPLALGTVGGLTSLHPLAKESLSLLDSPNAKELMMIVASVGLAQNFGAVSSLITTGIQKGHMKMHLLNILNQLNANNNQIEDAKIFFKNKVISYNEVRNFLNIH